METRKKVLMIIPNLGFGGAQRVFHDASIGLSRHYEVIECVFNFDEGHAYPSGNSIVSLDVPAGKFFISKLYFFILRILRLRRLKKQLGVWSAISHLEGADYINILSKRTEHTILYIHGSKLYDKNISGFYGWIRKNILMRSLYGKADKIIAVATGIKAELESFLNIPSSRIQIINNGFDLNKIGNNAQATVDPDLHSLLKTKLSLITHGRLVDEKDHKTLVRVLLEPGMRNLYRLFIVGDGPLRQMLIEYSRHLGLNTYSHWDDQPVSEDHEVLFLGYATNPFSILSKATVYGFPSLYEGFPMALGEAMACGLPIVSRNCHYGPGEILNPSGVFAKNDTHLFSEYGVLISNDLDEGEAPKVWAQVLKELSINRELLERYQERSLERCQSFSIESFYEKLTIFFKNL